MFKTLATKLFLLIGVRLCVITNKYYNGYTTSRFKRVSQIQGSSLDVFLAGLRNYLESWTRPDWLTERCHVTEYKKN